MADSLYLGGVNTFRSLPAGFQWGYERAGRAPDAESQSDYYIYGPGGSLFTAVSPSLPGASVPWFVTADGEQRTLTEYGAANAYGNARSNSGLSGWMVNAPIAAAAAVVGLALGGALPAGLDSVAVAPAAAATPVASVSVSSLEVAAAAESVFGPSFASAIVDPSLAASMQAGSVFTSAPFVAPFAPGLQVAAFTPAAAWSPSFSFTDLIQGTREGVKVTQQVTQLAGAAGALGGAAGLGNVSGQGAAGAGASPAGGGINLTPWVWIGGALLAIVLLSRIKG